MPELTLLFDIEPSEGLSRIAADKGREQNRLDLEEIDFHQKVHDAYHQLADKYPNRIKVINAGQSFDKVKTAAYQVFAPAFPQLNN